MFGVMDPSEIAVALARIEGKNDVALARIEAKLDAAVAATADHETRLREHTREIADLKARPYVTPKQLAGWLTLGLTTVGTAAPYVLFSLR